MSNKKQKPQKPEKNYSFDVVLTARNEPQRELIKAVKDHDITIVSGPPGTGKTHIPVAFGIQQLLRNKYSKMILTRPCVEAYGENLGFLPGTAEDKIEPYIRPIREILNKSVGPGVIDELISNKMIEVLPLAHQRGWTFENAFVIGDEFQNTLPQQLRMFLTRMGENCKIVVTGDPEQADRPGVNGLIDALTRFKDIPEIAIIHMGYDAVVRHPLVSKIDRSYGQNSQGNTGKKD